MPTFVWLALAGLHARGEGALPATPHIRRAIEANYSPVGVYAAHVLREIGPPLQTDVRLFKFLHAEDAETRELAAMLLEHTGAAHAVPALVELLGDGKAGVSTAGIHALGGLARPEQAIPLLIQLFREANDDDTRDAAAFALGRIEARAAKTAAGNQ